MMAFIVDNDFIKGGVIISFFWFFWFHKSNQTIYNRRCIIIGIVSSFAAIIVSRILAVTLPFRRRPVYNNELHFVKPFKWGEYGLVNWSSFPSDHATMFFALATGIFLISKKAGIFAYLYVLIIICFPRIYLGYHYPTDILVGAVIGIVITYIISINRISNPVIKKVSHFSLIYPGFFYALVFLISFQICTMFSEIR